MYLVTSKGRLRNMLLKELQRIFADHAEIKINGDRIDIKINSGYDRVEKKLTQKQIDEGVIGGGVEQALNGHKFQLSLEEIY